MFKRIYNSNMNEIIVLCRIEEIYLFVVQFRVLIFEYNPPPLIWIIF